MTLWLLTAAVSILGFHGRSDMLLRQTSLPASSCSLLIWGGAALLWILYKDAGR